MNMGQERAFGTLWNTRTSSCLVPARKKKLRVPVGSAQQIPFETSDGICWVIHLHERLTRGPCSSKAVRSLAIREVRALSQKVYKQAQRSPQYSNRTYATWITVKRLNINVMVGKVSWKEESDRAGLKHRNVEFRIAQDGADMYFLKKEKNLFIEQLFSRVSSFKFDVFRHFSKKKK